MPTRRGAGAEVAERTGAHSVDYFIEEKQHFLMSENFLVNLPYVQLGKIGNTGKYLVVARKKCPSSSAAVVIQLDQAYRCSNTATVSALVASLQFILFLLFITQVTLCDSIMDT